MNENQWQKTHLLRPLEDLHISSVPVQRLPNCPAHEVPLRYRQPLANVAGEDCHVHLVNIIAAYPVASLAKHGVNNSPDL
jgi:hypothetical protein